MCFYLLHHDFRTCAWNGKVLTKVRPVVSYECVRNAAQPTTMPGTGSMQCPGTATEHAVQPQLWRPLLHHERFEYNFRWNHDGITRGYVIEVEVILPGHMHCGCYVPQHAITEKWFREESTDDGEYPVHYLVSDQWHREIARNGFAASALNGKVLTKVSVICYGHVRHHTGWSEDPNCYVTVDSR